MKIEELAALMGKSAFEVREMLKKESVIELNLVEKAGNEQKDDLKITDM